MCVRLSFTINRSGFNHTQYCNTWYTRNANGNSGRGLLDRNKSEDFFFKHPQSSNESIKTKQGKKTTKRKGNRSQGNKKANSRKDLLIHVSLTLFVYATAIFFFLTVPCCSRYFTWASHHDQSFYSTLFTYPK